MVHSVELLFDADTESVLRRIWDELADSDVPARIPAGRPHVTLVAAEQITGAADEALRAVARRLPLDCEVGAPLLFGQSNTVLARLIVPTAELLALHSEVYRVCEPHCAPRPLEHSRPDHWTAHATVARRVDDATVRPMLAIAAERTEIGGRLVAMRRWDGTERVEYPLG